MKDDDSLPVSTPTSTSSIPLKKEISSSAAAADHSSVLFGRGRYKFWAFAAILLLAFWSMVTGTVTLRWSAANLNDLSDRDSLDFPLPDDLDVLEMEEREKLVRKMWDVYTSNGRRIGLAKYWEDAFKSAYEEMTSEVPGVQDAAVSEIAKMSLRSIRLEPPPSNPLDMRKMKTSIARKQLNENSGE
ncbi:OLC1v1010821C1 [Oldenlandia corymbosa var. corymbosa]|uniref:OLC1v1010821C1 n=1 Tax=Oldenlandia corymbosa var. corymbosa TaxID=529605 RepID=A0AAV1DS63_OLDCO|nr:OLC1v1010821C1 [Oldenlandia corymbosa var. corymbosa]